LRQSAASTNRKPATSVTDVNLGDPINSTGIRQAKRSADR
jgi:hypothetical protein